jgi:hypothetical protein
MTLEICVCGWSMRQSKDQKRWTDQDAISIPTTYRDVWQRFRSAGICPHSVASTIGTRLSAAEPLRIQLMLLH